jgi:pyruvate kinase
MLSGETANGGYPVAAVSMMAKISTEAEELISYHDLYDDLVSRSPTPIKTPELLAAA